LYEKCNNYDLMVTDGRYFYWFARLLGAPIKYDISIPFLSELIMELADQKHFSMMLLGSSEDTNEKATDFLRKKYPNATVYNGYTGGSFSEDEQLISVAEINKNKPDILFIGASTPLKEDFATRWKDDLNVGLIVPFGGMIDGLAGKVRLTPPILKKLGLATFVRIAQEPRRLFAKNMWQFYEFFFKLLPLTIYYRFLLRKKNFNLVHKYLRKDVRDFRNSS